MRLKTSMKKIFFFLPIFFLWFPNVSHAAISVDNSLSFTRVSSATVNTVSFTTAGSNRYLIVNVRLINGGTTATATYGGVSMTQIGTTVNPATNNYLLTFGLANPALGANNIVVTANIAGYIDVTAASYDGASSVEVISSGNSIPAASVDNTLTTLTDNSWMLVSFASGAPVTSVTNGVNRTYDSGGNNYSGINDSNAAITPTGSYTITSTRSSNLWWGWNQFALTPYVPTPSIPWILSSWIYWLF